MLVLNLYGLVRAFFVFIVINKLQKDSFVNFIIIVVSIGGFNEINTLEALIFSHFFFFFS